MASSIAGGLRKAVDSLAVINNLKITNLLNVKINL